VIDPPIFVVDGGDVTVLRDEAALARCVEPYDIDLPVYDAIGRLIRLVADADFIRVVIVGVEIGHAEELRKALARFLAHTGTPSEWISGATLQELVQKSAQYIEE
jgi:hypothetical protein